MDSLLQLYILAIMLSIFFGFIAKKTEFCPLGGIADIIKTGNDGRFLMYVFAIGVAILGATLLEAFAVISFNETKPPYRISQFRWLGYILGGFLFGFGMTLSRGCGMKNMLNLGSGDMRAIIAVLGMAIAGYTLLYIEGVMGDIFGWVNAFSPNFASLGVEHQDLGSIASYFFGGDVGIWRTIIGISLAMLFFVIAFRSSYFRRRKNNMLGGLFIGMVIIAAYYLSGGELAVAANEISDFMDEPQYGLGMQSYTFIRPMGDTLQVLTNPVLYLVTLGLVMFLGVGVGSLIYSLFNQSFVLRGISISTAPRYFIGGLLVGIGGILGMGCTLGQGLAGTSTLALGSFVDLLSLIIGAYVGIKLQSNFMDDHELPQ